MPGTFFLSNLVTLFVLFNGFDLKDLFEKKFCKYKKKMQKLNNTRKKVSVFLVYIKN